MSGVVIVGACQAGLQAAVSLRELGYQEPIALVGDEPHLPYQRPPLSKGFITGQTTSEQLSLRVGSFFDDHDIDLVTGERVTGIDRSTQRAVTASGRELAFDHLVLAVGAAPRTLGVRGTDVAGVHDLRGLDDAEAIAAGLKEAHDVVVLGGGFIGLELAATAAGLGRSVTIVEATAGLMGRAVSPAIAATFLAQHRARGVDVRLGTSVVEVVHDGTRATGVRLSDGEVVAADLVIVGIGASPRTELATGLGLDVATGVLVDGFARTSDCRVLAAGDCAQHREINGTSLCVTSVQNAIDQAVVAARTIVGDLESPYAATPWFWSDQYDLKLQMAGLPQAYDHRVVRGDPASGAFSILYVRDDRLVWAESVSKPGDHVLSRRLITQGSAVDVALAGDPSVPLRDAVLATTTA
ncbi:NAD(P)/FAD-dependent oxidoreductase [Nocardioides hwasunensis]|uniref:FAD-dependent oxidoreductase n=1 Tax=Nocardioides hwasunensis TaxID=397258 RepID=A0ABR8MGG8_9ACTN|nr:FAD-dependent oxidoreductase [Nocardioides hwasunensis]MBD3915053.1 FAD-dependent oxidoreductase [Nocardioides hwasunensis]